MISLALAVLQGEKRRAYDNYQHVLGKTKEQIVTSLRHPSGQLALLNPTRVTSRAGKPHPVLLPFAGIDFSAEDKVRHAVEMSDCLIHFERGTLCVAIGNEPRIGGFIYVAGTFESGPLVAHEIGNRFLGGSHRLYAAVHIRGSDHHWIAPFEILPPRQSPVGPEGVRGRFTGFLERDNSSDTSPMRPDKDFLGWVWQRHDCIDKLDTSGDCKRRSFFSLRLPVSELIADYLNYHNQKVPWPPSDLGEITIDLYLLPPGADQTRKNAIFDSLDPPTQTPFSLHDLEALLQAGETLRIQRVGERFDLVSVHGKGSVSEPISQYMSAIIRWLPGNAQDVSAIELEDEVRTESGNYRIQLHGDANRVVISTLSGAASRLSWFVGAVMLSILLTWIMIEISIIRRIVNLTQRVRQVPPLDDETAFMAFNFADLKESDELGILADRLDQLLSRIKENASRDRIRVAQEKEQWHAVGHEIMSPLQSLMALYGDAHSPAYRYIARMQQAIRVLYGSASPSEAFESSTMKLHALDLNDFLTNIATNAPHIGIKNVLYHPLDTPVPVQADEYSLEDVFGHLLKNAERYRATGTPITLSLMSDEKDPSSIWVRVHNTGPAIANEALDKIFEYGFSDAEEDTSDGRRGQGLFVAKTYMAKMAGTIRVANERNGVSFYLGMKLAGV